MAHIYFKHPFPVQEILTEHGQAPFRLYDRALDLEISHTKERMSRAVKAVLFVGNLPFYTNKDEIRDLFQPVAEVYDVTHGWFLLVIGTPPEKN